MNSPLLKLFLPFAGGTQVFLGMVKSSYGRYWPLGESQLFMCLKYPPWRPPSLLLKMLTQNAEGQCEIWRHAPPKSTPVGLVRGCHHDKLEWVFLNFRPVREPIARCLVIQRVVHESAFTNLGRLSVSVWQEGFPARRNMRAQVHF